MSIKSSRPRVDDLWTKLDNSPKDSEEDGVETTLLFVGDSQCGKTTMIQSFLSPTAGKDPKPTFALEYSFARKKVSSNQNSKAVSHIWELGGDIHEPSLLEIPLATKNIGQVSVIVCCDLSQPHNVFASILRWISLVRGTIQNKLSQLKSSNPNLLTTLRAACAETYSTNSDKNRVKPCEVPIYIVCNKYDLFKEKTVAERRALIQAIRFIAHYHGATLICTSSQESSLRENFRGFLSSVCFRSALKNTVETSPEKPVYVFAGKDTFDNILLSTRSGEPENSRSSLKGEKSRLVSSELEVQNFVTNDGVTKKSWDRISEHLDTIFGPPDAAPEESKMEVEGGGGEREGEMVNEFPEPEVDEMRKQRDAALLRLIQEMDRKDATMARMNETRREGEEKK